MDKIHVVAYLTIQDGKQEQFKALAAEAVDVVRAQDSGTETYDWYFNADETECVVRETYASSEAVLEHISHVGPLLEKLVEIAEIRLELFGRPSEELAKVGEAFGQVIYTPFIAL